jgi:sulfopyruvate decarboxylase subunit alpha
VSDALRSSAVDTTLATLTSLGVSLIVNVPDSWMAPLVRQAEQHAAFDVVRVTNEGEGVALCAGAWLGGRKAVMVMENSGVRMACEELARLGLEQGIPTMLLMPFRGDLGDGVSWAQSMGITTQPILDALRIPYAVVRDDDAIADALIRADRTLRASLNHVAVLFGIELMADERA